MSNPAIEAARKQDTDERVLSSGVRVRIHRLPQLLLDDAVHMVEEPPVPYIFDEGKGYEIPNPDDPRYIAKLEQYERNQSRAIADAVIIWGVQLVDGIPDESEWLPQLEFYEKRGHISLAGYDLDNRLEREFVYKRYVALSAEEFKEIMPLMVAGVTQEDVDKATESFQGD